MTEKEFLKKIGITDAGYFSKNSYVIDLYSDREYSKYYTKLDNSNLVEEDEASTLMNANASNIRYISDEFDLTLLADYDADSYSLIVKKH